MLYEVITAMPQAGSASASLPEAVVAFLHAAAGGIAAGAEEAGGIAVITSYSIHYTKLYDMQEFGAEFIHRHHDRIHLPTQLFLGRVEGVHDFFERCVADDQDIYIAGNAFLAPGNRSENERQLDLLPQRQDGLAQYVRQAHRLDDDAAQLLENCSCPIGLIESYNFV